MTQVFDGNERAVAKERELKLKVKRLEKSLKLPLFFMSRIKPVSFTHSLSKQRPAGLALITRFINFLSASRSSQCLS